ncbi:hypothetical protein Syun_006510 [Stephania yunnanensis]|uniref:Uncharacterized protein n=1 Tax=Stephania yunnanensis TaxID=152371 RepID=A0AAP0L050_9MAGN
MLGPRTQVYVALSRLYDPDPVAPHSVVLDYLAPLIDRTRSSWFVDYGDGGAIAPPTPQSLADETGASSATGQGCESTPTSRGSGNHLKRGGFGFNGQAQWSEIEWSEAKANLWFWRHRAKWGAVAPTTTLTIGAVAPPAAALQHQVSKTLSALGATPAPWRLPQRLYSTMAPVKPFHQNAALSMASQRPSQYRC